MFTCIGKGLYFHEKHTPWLGGGRVFIEFMLSFGDLAKNERRRLLVERLDTILGSQPLRGNNQDVFGYQFVEADGKAMTRLHCYGNSKVFVDFVA